jgi:hypothetical protein
MITMKCAVAIAILAALPAFAAFNVEFDGARVTVTENGAPVYVYNVEPVPAPEGVNPRFTRAAYIHPLYGLDGEVLTQDFPSDHYHHRGVFWTWPGGKLGDREFNIWSLDGAHPYVDNVLVRAVGASADLHFQNRWSLDDSPEDAFIREEVDVIAHPADPRGRALDFTITLTNVSDEVFSLGGSEERDKRAEVTKGYGGFCIRPDAAYKPMVFTTATGVQPEDVLEADTPWADVSFRIGETGPHAGMAIFQHPSNPGYPHPGWIFRHYSFLGASYPHTETLTLQPNESFTLRYRLYVHRGTADEAKVKEAFETYTKDATAE